MTEFAGTNTPSEILVENIPSDLRAVNSWVTWRFEQRNGKATKLPVNPRTGRLAKTNDPSTWVSFDEAVAAVDGNSGVGFVFGQNGFVGFDLDKCRDPVTGVIDAWAQAVIDRLASYSEVSPSGTGVHVIAKASLPPTGRKTTIPDAREGAAFECYERGRFFCTTGDRLPDPPATVEERQAEVLALHAEFFGREPEPAEPTIPEPSTEPEETTPAPTDPDLRARLEAFLANDPGVADAWSRRNPKPGRKDLSASGWAQCLLNLLAHRNWTRPELEWAVRHFYATQAMQPEDNPLNPAKLQSTVETALRSAAKARAGAGTDAQTAAGAANLTDIDRAMLSFNITDSGNAERISYLYGDRLRFDHKRKRWLVWQGNWWAPDKDGELWRLAKEAARALYAAASEADNDRARKFAFGSENRARLDAALHLSRQELPIADNGEGWDADPFLIGVPNGVVDLRTGELRSGRPDDRVTMCAAVPFNPNAQAPRWRQFLKDVFDDDAKVIEYVRKALGYSATGDMREQVCFLCHGQGANGKSVLHAAVRFALGDYGADTPFSTFEQDGRSSIPVDLAALEGKRFVTAAETGEAQRLNEARLKAWTGGDPCTCRFMRQNLFTYQPVGKIWLNVNHRPHVRDGSEGLWRRIRLIPFLREFKGKQDDRELSTKLRAEAEGILAWLVRGAVEWQRSGLQAPDIVQVATAQYREDSDPLGDFLLASCTIGPDHQAYGGALYEAYERWADETNTPASERLSSTSFGTRLTARFRKEKTRRGKLYHGIRLLSDPQLPLEA